MEKEQQFIIGDDLLKRIGDFLEEHGDTSLLNETHNLDFADADRVDFMAYFRSPKFDEQLTNDDRIEVFLQALPGDSDLTPELLENLCQEYGTSLEEVLERKPNE